MYNLWTKWKTSASYLDKIDVQSSNLQAFQHFNLEYTNILIFFNIN